VREVSNTESPGESNTEQYRARESGTSQEVSKSELHRRASRLNPLCVCLDVHVDISRYKDMPISRYTEGFLTAKEISAEVAGEGRGEGSR